MKNNPKLVEIAERIVQLKRFTTATGTFTNKSQSALIRDLDPIELSVVASIVNAQLANQEQEAPNVSVKS